ncbi:rect: recombinase, phage RecT family [Gaiella occulta]|uniref:Rect: recombinase, phage RecT family n=1 Tax=Gaiella occulta TaxID=1002870 RepID=A0A7M2YTW4_9ACTN|nr:recombinase RecT [Gaiella occulta]RDI73334.1 rect: recombinase, phage RecT family [Gaiella occulta]
MSTAVARRDPVAEVCTTIASKEFEAKIVQALPDGVTPARFVRTTLTAIQQNPDVVKGTRQSLYNAVIRCAQDGLLPDGREAALVVFRAKGTDVVQYLPMIGGLRKIAAEYGIKIETAVVYERDKFEWELGFEPRVLHVPPALGEDRGEPIGAYAVATDKLGRKYVEVMSRQEIEEVRKVSRAATSEYGPWVKWWAEMARKTVGRRLFKQLPLHDLDERGERVISASDAEISFSPSGLDSLPHVDPSEPEEVLTGDVMDDDDDDGIPFGEPAA